jgi:hypothetical protein
MELTHGDGQVSLIRAGWQLWDWEDGGKARLWLVRAECGCADRGGKWESCAGHTAAVGHRLIQLASDWRPLDPKDGTSVVRSIQATT